MEIAVISDLHLGALGRTDEFGHDDAEFLKFLKFLEGNFEKIVLLGDIWECLTAPSRAGQFEQLRAAQGSHREINKRFAHPKYQYIHGNHDLVAGEKMGVQSEYTVEADGVRMMFSHGHQGDSLCSTARPFSEYCVWLGAWIRRMGLQWVYAFFAQLERMRSNCGDCRVRRWALSQAQSREFDVVVTGHTHVPRCDEVNSSLFLNSGTCAHGQISYLSLDTKRGNYHVHAGY